MSDQGAQRGRGQRGERLSRSREDAGVPATLDRGRVLVGKRPGTLLTSLLIGALAFVKSPSSEPFVSSNVVAKETKSIAVVSHRGEARPIRIC